MFDKKEKKLAKVVTKNGDKKNVKQTKSSPKQISENEKKFQEKMIRDLLDPTLEGIYYNEEKKDVEICESGDCLI